MLDFDSEHATRPAKFLLFAATLYLAVGVVEFLPAVFAVLLGLAFLVFWLGVPVALYKDRRYVRGHTDWNPSKAYYLGFLPGYLGVGALLLYLHRRQAAFDRSEVDEEATGTDPDVQAMGL